MTPSMEPGRSLFQARTDAGLSIDDVAGRLHLSPRQVSALDNNQFDELPEATYVKGYLQNYARLLGLDPAPLLAAFAKHHAATRAVERTVAIASPQQLPSNDGAIKWTAVIVGFAVVVLSIIWWQAQEGADDGVPALTSIEGGTLESTDGQAPFGDSEILQDSEEISREELFGAADNGDGIGVAPRDPATGAPGTERMQPPPAVESLPQAAPAPPPAQTQPLVEQPSPTPPRAVPTGDDRAQLVLYVNEESWIDIRDAKLNKLLYETVAKGRVVKLEGIAPFSVFLGNAGGVRLFLNGKEYDIEQHRRGLVARFKLDAPAATAAQ